MEDAFYTNYKDKTHEQFPKSYLLLHVKHLKSRHDETKYNSAIVVVYHETTWNEVTVYIW